MLRQGALVAFLRLLTAPVPRIFAWSLLGASLAALVWLVFERAWIGEDAFITFRTVDQFVHGNGLRWNPDERVQAYTHPLWMLSCIPFYAATRSLISAVVTLGLVCTGGAYLFLGSRLRHRPFVLLAGLFLPLVGSGTFLNYGTSGFENSMTHLCYAAFAWVYLRGLDRGALSWGGLALAGSLAVTNRLDTVLVFIPPIAWLLLRHFREVRWGRFLLGFTPIVAWLLFATFYYGFPYPNTALAKVNEEVARRIIVLQGLYYVLDLVRRDPVAFLSLSAGLALTVSHGIRAGRGRGGDASAKLAALGAGGLLYVGYVVYIGGSYISGRHLLLPALVGTVLWAELLLRGARRVTELDLGVVLESWRPTPRAWVGAAGIAVAAGSVLLFGPDLDPRKVATAVAPPGSHMERYRYIRPIQGARLYLDADLRWQRSAGARKFWELGEKLRGPVAVSSKIGLSAIAAGRDMIIIDRYALADPLLARLPPRSFMMVGHFKREVPAGYRQARETGDLGAMDPALAAYYRPLREIVSGPLFSRQRLAEIVKFNLGRYDDQLADYVARRSNEDRSWSLGRSPGSEPDE
jgi:arabinofuranosyltransferase